MNRQADLRKNRRAAVNSMMLLAVGGFTGALAIAAVTLWLNWPNSSPTTTSIEVDSMSMIG